jgi:hypothetical protein
MRRTRAPYTHRRLERDEPELGGVGLGNTYKQYDQNLKHRQPSFAPCSLALGPVLGGPHPDRQSDADKTLDSDDDCITSCSSPPAKSLVAIAISSSNGRNIRYHGKFHWER